MNDEYYSGICGVCGGMLPCYLHGTAVIEKRSLPPVRTDLQRIADALERIAAQLEKRDPVRLVEGE